MSNAQNDMNDVTAPKNIPANLGAIPEELKGKLNAADPTAEIPCFVPNKEGFTKGKTLAGYYLRTNRVYSNKFTAGKKDEQGNKYRDQHIFKDASGNVFGIWSVGILGYTLAKVQPNTFIAITYLGLSDKALRQGESPSHMFKFEGVNLDLTGKAVDSSSQ